MQKFKRVSSVLVLALAAMALTASTAMAEVQWSHSQVKWSGTLTFKRNGGDARTCTFNHLADIDSSGHYRPSGSHWWTWSVPCATPAVSMSWVPEGYPESDGEGGYELSFWDATEPFYKSSAWSTVKWGPSVIEGDGVVPFTNASGGTPSHITFEEDSVGVTNYNFEPVTASGTIYMLTADGKSSVTLSGE